MFCVFHTVLCKNMPSEMYFVFQKNSFIKKSVEQSKNKECKKRFIIKKVSYENFPSRYKYTSI